MTDRNGGLPASESARARALASTALTGAAGLAPFLGVPTTARAAPAARQAPRRADDDAGDTDMAQEDDAEGDPEENPDDRDGDRDVGEDPEERPTRTRRAQRDPDDDGDDDSDPDDPDRDEDEEEWDDDEREMRQAAAVRDPKRRDRAVAASLRNVRARAAVRTRKAEQARVSAILRHPSAAGNLKLATRLAFHTRMSAKAACKLLDAAGPGAGAGLADRMSPYAGIRPGSSAPQRSTAAALDASWDAAAKAAGITR